MEKNQTPVDDLALKIFDACIGYTVAEVYKAMEMVQWQLSSVAVVLNTPKNSEAASSDAG